MWVLGEASGRRLPSYATFLEKRRELPRAMIMVCIAGAPEGVGWVCGGTASCCLYGRRRAADCLGCQRICGCFNPKQQWHC